MKCSSSLHLLLSDILKTRTVLFTHSIHSTKQARSRHTWYIPTLHTSVPDCVYPLLILVPFLHLVQSPPLEDYFFLNEDSGQLLDIQMILTIMLRSQTSTHFNLPCYGKLLLSLTYQTVLNRFFHLTNYRNTEQFCLAFQQQTFLSFIFLKCILVAAVYPI